MKKFVKAALWTGSTGRAIRNLPTHKDVRLLEVYLITGPLATLYGLYPLTLEQVTVDTALTADETAGAFAVLQGLDFAHYDPASSFVWVVEMAAQQLTLPLKATDFMVKAANRWYREVRDNPFLRPFWRRYARDLRLEDERLVVRRGSGLNGEPLPEVDTPRAERVQTPRVVSELEGWFVDVFWPAYPRHTHRREALKAIETLNPGAALRVVILEALEAQKATVWAAADVSVIPSAATWLTGERWTDEMPTGPAMSRRTAAAARAIDEFSKGGA